jgi:hypothetical protein
MADKTRLGGSDPNTSAGGHFGASDLDPFAELTKIMGFDPREPVAQAAAQTAETGSAEAPVQQEAAPSLDEVEDDFGVDLEKELMGDLADDVFGFDDEPVVESAADVEVMPVETVAEATVEPETVQAAPAEVELDLDEIENDIAFEVEEFLEASAAPVSTQETASEAVTGEPVAAAVDEDFSHEDEFDAAFGDIDVTTDAHEEGVVSPVLATEEDHAAAVSAPAVPEANTVDDEFDRLFGLDAGNDDTWEPKPFLKDHHVAPASATMADVDMDFDAALAEADLNVAPQVNAGSAGLAAELEAEYNALLGNSSVDAAPEKPAPAMTGAIAAASTAAIVAGAWGVTKAVKSTDEPARQEAMPFSAVQPSQPDADEVDAAFDNAMAFDDADQASPAQRVAADDQFDDAGLEPDFGFESDLDEHLADAIGAAGVEEKVSSVEKPVPVSAQDDPFAALAAMAQKYQTNEYSNDWRTEPAPRRETPVAPAQHAKYAPEIETVDFYDNPIALADDLDIPDVAYENEPPASFDDLDAEFNSLLSEMSSGERRVQPAVAAQPAIAPHRVAPAYVEQRQSYQAPAAPAKPAYAAPAAEDDYFDDGMFDDLADDMADSMEQEQFDDRDYASTYAAAEPERRPRRGLFLAAIIGGLALVGGISVVALSFGSASVGEPALVKADNEPVKVRPENPGGTTIPNQDNTVYDTVSRSGSNEPPTQSRLVSSTEEPMELPQPNDEEVDEVAAIAKSEDRVEPSAAGAEEANPETVAVAPRKVRTMVVNPDGTLAPREESAPEVTGSTKTTAPVAEEPGDEIAAVAAESEPEQITTGATQPVAPAKPAAEPKQVAAVPGGWAVQVSSQPSEEGANKSLKDISRKYASVIGDRGAGIVKAEVPGKGTFWRVRIPAGSKEEAVNICGDLKSAGGSCFVTK